MPKLSYTVETSVEPARVLAAATDFSDRRLELWPDIDPSVFRVHGSGEGWAEVTEGTAVFGGVWARERFEWSGNVVRGTVQESNIFQSGGTWEMRVEPREDGGCVVHVSVHRRAKGKGYVTGAIMQVAGRRMLPRMFGKTLAVLEETAAS